MLKKTFVLGVAGFVLLGLLFGRSHVLTTLGMVKQHVKSSVPIDFEIERARQMITDLRPEIEKNLRLIAQEEVEVARLEDDLERSESHLARDRGDILRLKQDLDSGSEVFVYAGRSYSARDVKTDLAARFEQFKTQEATTGALHKILAARQASLKAAREKLDGMLDAKRQLEVDVENLEARLAMVEVAQTTSNVTFDDSRLSRTKELIDEIGMRIEVAEKLVHADVHYFERIPLDEPEADRDITEEIADYFGEGRDAVEEYVRSIE
jgi:chromosome segregation ATPase